MNPEELKSEIRQIFGAQIEFNNAFDQYVTTIKNLDVNLIEWCKQVLDKEINPLRAPNAPELRVFIKKIGSSNRCIVIKLVNGEFREVHLGNHAYYDHLRKKLGLKKDSL